MNKFIPLLIILYSLFSALGAKAEPFSPNIYMGYGYNYAFKGSFTNAILEENNHTIELTDPALNQKQKRVLNNFNLGISPNIPLRLLQNLRLQVEYNSAVATNSLISGDTVGAGVYFDIYMGNFLPILTPYIGATEAYYTKIYLDSSSLIEGEKIASNNKLFSTSLNAGLSLQVPLTPFTVFGEYRYSNSKLFNQSFTIKLRDTTTDTPQTLTADYLNETIFIGVRYQLN